MQNSHSNHREKFLDPFQKVAVVSEDSGAPTNIGDGKMGRARSQSRGIYAMDAPRTNMSRFFSMSDDMEGPR